MHCSCRFEHNDWAQQTGSQSLQKPDLDYRLYAVTDPGCNVKCERSNAEAVQLAVQGGATLIQLREKAADGGAFVREAQALMDLLRPTGVSVGINCLGHFTCAAQVRYVSSLACPGYEHPIADVLASPQGGLAMWQALLSLSVQDLPRSTGVSAFGA